MGHTKEYRRLRADADMVASEHAKLFDRGHEGAAHCGCGMAQQYRTMVANCEKLRTKKPETCPTCGRSLSEKHGKKE